MARKGDGTFYFDEKKKRYRAMLVTPTGKRVSKSSKNAAVVKKWLNEQRLLLGRDQHITDVISDASESIIKKLAEAKTMQTENVALKVQITVIQEEIKNAYEAVSLKKPKLVAEYLNKARNLTSENAVLEIENVFDAARMVIRHQNLREFQIAVTRLSEALDDEKLVSRRWYRELRNG